MKKDAIIRGFARSISDDDLDFMLFRFAEHKSGDLGDVVEFIQEDPDMDRLFSAAKDANELYDLIDEVNEYVTVEMDDRCGPKKNRTYV